MKYADHIHSQSGIMCSTTLQVLLNSCGVKLDGFVVGRRNNARKDEIEKEENVEK